MRTWYNLKAAEANTPAKLSIFDDIGAYGVSAKSFLNDLGSVTQSSVDVEINSPGGDVFAGLAIYNGLRNSGKKINVKVLGLAASAASLIAMAGDTIEMPENSFMMIHNPWGFAAGDANEMRATADVLDKIGSGLVSTYAKRTGKSEDEITALLNAETWMTAQEAVDAGFATKVVDAVQAKASFELERLPENVRAAYEAGANDGGEVDIDPEDPDADLNASAEVGGATGNEGGGFVAEPTFADQVQEVAASAGLEVYAAVWALDSKLADIAAVKARAAEAREIAALCKVAGKPDMADGLIRNAATLVDARSQVFAALADGQEHIDTSVKASTTPVQGAQPKGVKTADVWAARRQQSAK